MSKNEKQVLICAVVLTFVGAVVFFTLWNVNTALVWGWLTGCLTSVLSFLLLVFFTTIVMNNFHQKIALGVFLLKIIVAFVLYGTIFWLMLFLNAKSQNLTLKELSLDGVMKPFNIVAYLGGLGVLPASIFVTNLKKLELNRKGITSGPN